MAPTPDSEALAVLDELIALYGAAHPTDGAILVADRTKTGNRHALISEMSDRFRAAFIRMREAGLIMIAPGCLNSYIRVPIQKS